MPESPLFEAHRIVHAERGADYGPPVEDFERTGRMWAAILGLPTVTPQQVALCMVALKVSREAYHHKRDSLVDIAGYVETLAMIEGESTETNGEAHVREVLAKVNKGEMAVTEAMEAVGYPDFRFEDLAAF